MLDVLRRTKDPLRRLIAPLAALLGLLALAAAPASADVVRKSSTADITINDASGSPAAATPYPSTLTVAGQSRAVVGVKVKLDDVTHGYAGDLDIALVGPDGHRVMLMSDTGGSTDLVATDLTFDDDATQPVPLGQDIPEGEYRPTDNDFGNASPDPFPTGAPQDFASRLEQFHGLPANGDWHLFVVDDTGGDGGQIGGWSLTLETGPTATYGNAIAMQDDGTAPRPAAPYGVPVQISGVQGTIAEASVELNGLRHADPGDIDVLLEGPGGEVTTLMSDAGGVADVTDRRLRFDDDAPTTLSDTDPLQDGTYKPTNNQGADNFPAPAPAQTASASLSVFDDKDPNGTWKLWVVDDAPGASGSIVNGFRLEIVVNPYVKWKEQTTLVGEAAGEKTVTVTRPEGGGAATVKYAVHHEGNDHDVAPAGGTLGFAIGQETKTFTVKVLDDRGDEPDEAVSMTIDEPTGDAQVDDDGSRYASLIIQDDDATDVRADFNGDGHEDIAVGAPGEDVGADGGAGLVNVVYGGASGLAAAGNQRFTQDSAGVPDATEPGDAFGTAISAGDFNGDGFGDLAIGVPGEELGAGTDSGVVTILKGSASGLTGTGSAMLGQDTAGVPNTSETGDRFGAALAAGNFGRTDHSDLAVGQPGEDVGAANGAGAITALYGSASGLAAAGAQYYSQDVAAIADTAESADAFGSVLAAGDLGRGAEVDLAIGAPGESQARGAAHVLYGSTTGGLGTAGSQLWTQDSPGVDDAAVAGDGFGSAVAIKDGNQFSSAQLAIGVPGEDIGAAQDAGMVNVLHGYEKDGVTSDAQDGWDQAQGTMADSPESGDRFGASLAFGDFGWTGFGAGEKSSKIIAASHADLAVGVPGETIVGVQEAGAVAVLYSSDGSHGGSLQDDENQLWHQGSTGVLDTNEAGDHFGAAVTAIRIGGQAALGVGVPGENAGAGAMAVLFRSPEDGLYSGGNQRWRQGLGGIQDTAEAGDGFASALTP